MVVMEHDRIRCLWRCSRYFERCQANDNGVIPHGCRDCIRGSSQHVYESRPDCVLEFADGYTYSAHPSLRRGFSRNGCTGEEQLPQRVAEEAQYF